MGLKELLKINTEDFEIYGNHSELALMAKPGGNGKIDFKKTAITLSCNNCNNEKIFNTSILMAMELVDENLPVYIYKILIFHEKSTSRVSGVYARTGGISPHIPAYPSV